MKDEITYADNSLSVEEYNHLRAAAGWRVIPERQAKIGLQNTFYSVSAKTAGKTIGMARVISDGGYAALIADVIVHPDYQGKGIGKEMITRIRDKLYSNIRDGEGMMISLLAAKGKEGFYSKMGFDIRPNDRCGAGFSQWIEK